MKGKRIISVIVVISCILAFVSSALAANIQSQAGQMIKYTVSLAEPAVLAGFKVYLDYDTSVFSLVSEDGEYMVEQGTFSTKGTMLCNTSSTGCSVLWYHTNNVTASGTLFTVALNVAENAASGVYPVTLRYEADDTVNVEEEKVSITLSGANVEVQGAEPMGTVTVTVEGASALVGETVSVPVSIRGNPGFSGLTVQVEETDGITFSGVKKGALLSENETGTLTVNPGTGIISWIDSEDTTGDGEIFALEFEIAESCEAGDYEIALILSEALNFVNCDSEPIQAEFKSGILTVADYVIGDADDDGVITGADAVKMARHIVGYEPLTGKNFKAADIDSDGKITSADCVKMARYLVGLIDSLT